MKQNDRRAGFLRGYFHVLPTDAAAPAGLQSFERGFFCRKARGIMLRSRGATRFAIRAMLVGENSFSKAGRPCDSLAHAPNFDDVDADGNYHRNKFPVRERCAARRGILLARPRWRARFGL